MKQIQLLITCLLIAHFSNGQAKGFLGKENFIAVSVPMHVEMSNARFSEYIYDKSSDLIEYQYGFKFNKLISLGLNAEYYRILTKRTGFGIEFNYFRRNAFFKSYQDNIFNDQGTTNNTLNYRFAIPRLNVYTYKAYYTYASSTSFLPIGARHKLAVGYQNFNLNHNNVFYQTSVGSTINEVKRLENIPEGLEYSYNAIELSYGATFSYPLSESLFLDLGFDFRYHIFLNNEQENEAQNELMQSNSHDHETLILQKIHDPFNTIDYKSMRYLWDMVSFKIGVSFAF